MATVRVVNYGNDVFGLKAYYKKLDTMRAAFDQFNEVENTKRNKEYLCGLIKKYVAEGIIVRKDNGKEVELSTDTRRMFNMAPDITITSGQGKIYICNDCLWGTLTGLYERINEMEPGFNG